MRFPGKIDDGLNSMEILGFDHLIRFAWSRRFQNTFWFSKQMKNAFFCGAKLQLRQTKCYATVLSALFKKLVSKVSVGGGRPTRGRFHAEFGEEAIGHGPGEVA